MKTRTWLQGLRDRFSGRARRGAMRKPRRSVLRVESLEDRLAPALVSWWTADGTALDSVGTNHGTLVSGAGFAPGQSNQAFSFDGVDDRVQVVDSESLKLTASMTIEGWIRADSLPVQQGEILFRGDDRGGLDPYSLSLQSSGILRFEVSSLTGAMSVSTLMPLGQFVHVAGTLDDATGAMRLYLNGVLMSQATTTVRPFGDLDPASNPGIGIGNHGGYPTTPHNFPFHGLIDELKVYDHARSAEDVLANFNAGKGSLQPTISVTDATVIEGDDTVRSLGAFVNSGSGGLNGPRHLVIGPDGSFYVASRFTNEILKYDGSGTSLGAFVTAGSGGLDAPWALTFGPDGNLFVTGALSHNVLRYNGATGEFIDEFVPAGAFGLNQPKGIAFDQNGDLYVSSTTGGGGIPGPHEVLRFVGPNGATPGAPLPASGQAGAVFVADGSGNLSNPNGLAFGPDGNLYVANTFNDAVNRYDATTGTFINAFVPTGSGGLDVTHFLAFRPDGYLYVTSQGNGAVLRYNASTGAFVDAIVPAGSGGLSGAAGLVFDATGNLYVASYSSNEVLRFGPGSQAAFTIKMSAPFPTPVSVDYSTSDGTALLGNDYLQASGTLNFVPGTWHQTVLATTVDDSAIELNETFSLVLSNPTGAIIADGIGVGTIVDNDTKFYVVDDAGTNLTYEYGSGTGSPGESYALAAGNTAPRGAASNAAGTTVWVLDANKTVYVYNPSGGLLGSWTAGGLNAQAQVEGIATNGTDIWIVDNKQDKVFKYTGAASRLSGSQNAASNFSLNSGNKNPKGIVTDGVHLWVVNDAAPDKVFKYTVAGTLVGSWTIDAANASPTGITLDPTSVSHLWIVDNGTDRVYQYDDAASRTSGSQSASTSFALSAGNTNPQDIADPPVSDALLAPAPMPSAAAIDELFAERPSLLTPPSYLADMIQALTSLPRSKRRF